MLSRLQHLLPQHLLTSFAGWLANCNITWLKNRLIQYFIWRYPIKLEEALRSDPYEYSNFNELFTRHLKPEARSIANGLYDLISPADGQISQMGKIEQGQIFQAKSHYFSVQNLLGNNFKDAELFKEGSFLTVYLAPADYHRVHMPLDGHLSQMVYVPGSLFSVNGKTAECTPGLFARNERVITFFDTSIGRVAVILVGAMIVGSIETVWAGTITPPRKQSLHTWHYDNPIYLKRGEELGHFKLGSTVILLFEKDTVLWDLTLAATSVVQMGQRIGMFKPDRL